MAEVPPWRDPSRCEMDARRWQLQAARTSTTQAHPDIRNQCEARMRSKNQQTPKPTEAELGILNVLWERGASTVRDIHEAHYRDDGTGYTTSLKMLQIMHAKGLVERDDSQRAHVYRAAISKEHNQKRFLSDIVQRVFDGSPSQLVLQALGGQPKASREELDEIRALLDDIEAGKKP
jgi:BlaI family transcriptional regulator, penicillinase repressor